MYTYMQYCRRFIFEGNEILRLSVKYPSLDKNTKINEFYQKLATECEIFCEKIKFFELCESFKREKAEQKAPIYQKYTYNFCAQISDISDENVSILLSVSFYRSKNEPILSFSDTQKWCLTTEMLLSSNKN